MVIDAQKVGDPRIHTVVQANIKNPRDLGDKLNKAADDVAKAVTGAVNGIKKIFKK